MFRVGQKVVCIKRGTWVSDSPWFNDERLPVYGDVYTVRDIDDGYVRLAEIVNPPRDYGGGSPEESMFLARRFRPVIQRETDISIFQEMLKPKKQTADNRLDSALHDHGFDPPSR